MSPSDRCPHDPRPVVAHVIDSLDGGGTERTLCALLGAFDPDRLTHVVVTMRDAGSAASSLPDHVACYPLSVRGRSRWAGFKLASVLRSYGVSLVHARNTGCWADACIARLTRPKMRLALGFHGSEEPGSLSPRVRGRVRLGMSVGATFVSVSEFGRQQLVGEGGAAARRVTVMPNGVDLRRFNRVGPDERDAIRHSLGLEPSSVAMVIVGSLTPVKGHSILLEAFAQVAQSCSTARLLVVGDGPLRTSLELQAQVLGVDGLTHWLGARNDIAQLLSAADCYVCASHSEGLSNAVLEAMAVGCPVVSTGVGDHAIVVRDGYEGRLVPPGDVNALSVAMRSLVDQPKMRQKFASAARYRAKAFDFRETVESYERFYESLLSRSTGGVVSPADRAGELPRHNAEDERAVVVPSNVP